MLVYHVQDEDAIAIDVIEIEPIALQRVLMPRSSIALCPRFAHGCGGGAIRAI